MKQPQRPWLTWCYVLLGVVLGIAGLALADTPLYLESGTLKFTLPNDGGTVTGTYSGRVVAADAGTPAPPDAGKPPDAGPPVVSLPDGGPAPDGGPPPPATDGGAGLYDPNVDAGPGARSRMGATFTPRSRRSATTTR